MMRGDAESRGDAETTTLKSDVKRGVALLLLLVLAIAGGANRAWQVEPEGQESLGGDVGIVATFLSEDRLVFAFELLGILLVAALVGAVVLAMRDREVA